LRSEASIISLREHDRQGRARAAWLWPAAILSTAALLFSVFLTEPGERGLYQIGIADLFMNYGQVLPLIGLGIGFRLLHRGQAALALSLFAIGLIAGFFAEHAIISSWSADWSTSRFATSIALLGPFSCITSAAVSLAWGRIRLYLAVLASPVLGAATGCAIALTNPSDGWQYPVSAGFAALWLTIAPKGILAPFEARWLLVGGRIFASWLVAIALLLGSSALLPRPAPPPPPATPAAEPITPPESEPMQTLRPSTDQPRSWLGQPERP
jgi:hypothetical protein